MAKKTATPATDGTPTRAVKAPRAAKAAGTPRPRARKAASTGGGPSPDLVEEIRIRAYYRSLSREVHAADPMADWLEAEAEVTQGR